MIATVTAKTQRSEVNFSNDSAIKSLTLISQEDSQHGAPCRIEIENGALENADFFQRLQKVVKALNATPDGYPKTPAEMSDGEKRSHNRINPRGNNFNYPNYRGNHILSGGDKASIDSMSTENLPNVAAKAVREMARQGMLSQDDLAKANQQLNLPPLIGVGTSPGREVFKS